ncbi:MAG: insulinase family protein, partial [Syntrophales bacterium]|nr:insulinase family protein [Syntrophales bacterium]
VRREFPISKDEDPATRAAVNVAWMLSENTDELTTLLLQITAGILVGSAAGPLRKALIDSHLGEDLSPVTGFEKDYKQTIFAVGLRGTNAEKGAAIEALILKTLSDVVNGGIDTELIEGTLHQVEFGGKEIMRSSMPYGIILMGWVYHTWLYGGDPLSGLNFPKMIAEIRRQWREKPDLFEGLVQTWLLDNPHRLLSIMEPSQTFLERQEAQFREKMARLRDGIAPEERAAIDRNAAALKAFQVETDSSEALNSLPKLRLSDIEREAETIPSAKTVIKGIPALNHDIFTNGIAYLDLSFDIAHVPEDLQPYLPLLGKLMTNMGAAGLGYETMAKRIALKTGGISCSLGAGAAMAAGGPWQKMTLRVKALYRNIPDAVAILADIVTAGDLSDHKRLEDLLTEKKNRLQASVVPSGHIFARRMAGASFSLPAWREEQWHGQAQLQFLGGLLPMFQKDKQGVADKIAMLKDIMLRKDGLTINLTADEAGLSALTGSAVDLVARLSGSSSKFEVFAPVLTPVNRGITIPAQVSYVAEAFPAPGYGGPFTAPLLIMSKLLANGYLYKTIRVQGGAYGGMSLYDPMDGVFAFLSYRDPHIIQTLKAYEGAVRIACGEKVTQDELEKAIIGTIAALDRPMDPNSKGVVALTRYFAGISDAYRQSLREEILSMTAERMQEMSCRFFEAAKAKSVIAVYGEAEKLKRANETLKGKLAIEPLV